MCELNLTQLDFKISRHAEKFDLALTPSDLSVLMEKVRNPYDTGASFEEFQKWCEAMNENHGSGKVFDPSGPQRNEYYNYMWDLIGKYADPAEASNLSSEKIEDERKNLINHYPPQVHLEFWSEAILSFPELKEDPYFFFEDDDNPHSQMADFARLTESAINNNQTAKANKCFELADKFLRNPDIHLENEFCLSYVVNLKDIVNNKLLSTMPFSLRILFEKIDTY